MQDTRKLDESEIRTQLGRMHIPAEEMGAAIESFEKWQNDRLEGMRHRYVKLMCRGRKFRRCV